VSEGTRETTGAVTSHPADGNERRAQRGPDLPVPDWGQAVPEEPPEALRCGEVWGTRCRAWVRPPNWAHGNHPTTRWFWARARDPACPPWLLQALAQDPQGWVRERAITNSQYIQQTLAGLAGAPSSWGVRWRVAANPACPPQLLQQLAQDPDQAVREQVANNPSCPPRVLEALARDPDQRVRTAALGHPNCPPRWRALGQL